MSDHSDAKGDAPTGKRILIDGDYRSQQQGSGITSYSRVLETALQHLGHSVSRLSSASSGSSSDDCIDAIAPHDQPEPPTGIRSKVQTGRNMLAGLWKSSATARRIDQPEIVIPQDPSEPTVETFIAPNAFTHAHYRHMFLNQFTQIQVPAKFDVLHLMAPLPIRVLGVKTITTIHDLIPIRLPYTTTDNKAEFVRRVRTCARDSDLVITVSEASKRDIVDILQIDPKKIHVTYQSSDLELLNEEEQGDLPQRLQRFGLQVDKYALFVGAMEPKKNLRRLIEAFLETDDDMPLAICGRKAWLWDKEMSDLLGQLSEKSRKRLLFLGHLDRIDIRRLYTGAQFVVLPSLYEGFGLPALDALRFGRPLLTSNIASLPEVCGEAAVYVAPTDRDDIRAGIERLMSDEKLRKQLQDAASQQAQKFTFGNYIQRLRETYAALDA